MERYIVVRAKRGIIDSVTSYLDLKTASNEADGFAQACDFESESDDVRVFFIKEDGVDGEEVCSSNTGEEDS